MEMYGIRNDWRPGKAASVRALARLCLLLLFTGAAFGQEPWELRVCADPDNAPISTRGEDGYENRIAAILADELGAHVSYHWTRIDSYTVRTMLRTGECDVIMSAAEGSAGMLNTVPYYRIPLVFVHRSEDALEIESLFDEDLRDLRLGTFPNTAAHMTLVQNELADNSVRVAQDASQRGAERIRPMLDALLDGTVDIAILPGAYASIHVERSEGALQMTPVSPELVPPFTPMFQLATMGVRARDEALRDSLNLALARRWDDVQAVFDDMGIPTLPTQAVMVGEPVDRFRIGVVAPFSMGDPRALDAVAEAAYFGGRLADDIVGRREGREGIDYEILFASGPSPDAAARATARLAVTHEVVAVVGGYDDDSALAMAQEANERNLLFLNAGATDDRLRNPACYPTTLHIEASDSMYIAALAWQATESGWNDWHVVHDGSERTTHLARLVSEAANALGARLTTSQVAPGPTTYDSALDEIGRQDSDAVFVLLRPGDAEMFVSQAEFEGVRASLLPFPWPPTQTREFYFRLAQVAPNAVASTPRVAAWDTTLSEHGADELALRFTSRSGEPMDPTGWTTYAAIEAVIQAVTRTGSRDPGVLSSYLTDTTTELELAKGAGTSISEVNHQLAQPLYQIALDTAVEWSRRVSVRSSIATVETRIPPTDDGSADLLDFYESLSDQGAIAGCSE